MSFLDALIIKVTAQPNICISVYAKPTNKADILNYNSTCDKIKGSVTDDKDD